MSCRHCGPTFIGECSHRPRRAELVRALATLASPGAVEYFWGYERGAAAAFGLMGMAEALRQRQFCEHGELLVGGDCIYGCGWVDPHEGEPECAGCGCGLHLHEDSGPCTMGAHGYTCPCTRFVEADDRGDAK